MGPILGCLEPCVVWRGWDGFRAEQRKDRALLMGALVGPVSFLLLATGFFVFLWDAPG